MDVALTHRVGFIPGPYDDVPPEAGAALGVAWLRQHTRKVVLVPHLGSYQHNDVLRRTVPKSIVTTRRSRQGPRITPAATVLGCWPVKEDLDDLYRHACQGGAVAIIRWDNGCEPPWLSRMGLALLG